jgi:hypothetical protein
MKRLLPFVLALAGLPGAAQAAPAPVVVCYPGGPVNEADAGAAMASMLKVVERVGEWPAGSFDPVFTAKAADCRKLLAERKPGFAIMSLGLFLEQRAKRPLVPLVQPRIKGATSEQYRVLVSKGRYASLADLKGKTLGGTVLEEPEFIGRIVFAGKTDPKTFFQLQPSRQAIRALRAVDAGELDAVILNGQQNAGLGSLSLKTPLEPVFTSAEIPLMGMAADEKATSAGDRTRFAKALTGMCDDAEGRKLCELFGVEAFVPADPAAFEPMIRLWKQGK